MQSSVISYLTSVFLIYSGIKQRSHDPEFPGGIHSRAIVAKIVDDGAVGDRCDPAF
jgi:hypothetical protein